jgi:hypothetical protein
VAVLSVMPPAELPLVSDPLVTLEVPGLAANRPTWAVAGNPVSVAAPTLVQWVPSAES